MSVAPFELVVLQTSHVVLCIFGIKCMSSSGLHSPERYYWYIWLVKKSKNCYLNKGFLRVEAEKHLADQTAKSIPTVRNSCLIAMFVFLLI